MQPVSTPHKQLNVHLPERSPGLERAQLNIYESLENLHRRHDDDNMKNDHLANGRSYF